MACTWDFSLTGVVFVREREGKDGWGFSWSVTVVVDRRRVGVGIVIGNRKRGISPPDAVVVAIMGGPVLGAGHKGGGGGSTITCCHPATGGIGWQM